MPQSGDTAEFDGAATVSGSGSASELSVTASGELTLTGANITADWLDILGAVTIAAGSIVDATTTTALSFSVGAGATVDVSGGSQLDVQNSNDDGTVTVDGATLTATVFNIIGDQNDYNTLGPAGLSIINGGSFSATSTSAVSLNENSGGWVSVSGSGSSLTAAVAYFALTTGPSNTKPALNVSGGASMLVNLDSPGVIGFLLNGDGKVSGAGSTLTVQNNAAVIGGELDISGGGAFSISEPASVTNYYALKLNGTLRVDGAGSTFTTGNGGVSLGENGGSGNIYVTGGGAATIAARRASCRPSTSRTAASPSATQGSSLDVSGGPTYVGASGGTASLTVEPGAKATFTATNANPVALDIGVDAGSSGSVLLYAGAQTDVTGKIVIGDNGSGSLEVDGPQLTVTDAAVSSPTVVLGAQADGEGTLTLLGGSLDLTDSGGLVVADAGAGDLEISGGADLTVSNVGLDPALVIAQQAGSTGEANIDGGSAYANSSLTVGDGGLIVGAAGTAALNITYGAELNIGGELSGLVAGLAQDATGTVTAETEGAAITVADNAVVIGDAGKGTLDILDSATLTVTGADASLDVGAAATGNGTVLLDDADATLDGIGGAIVGDAGTGTLTIQNTATMALGDANAPRGAHHRRPGKRRRHGQRQRSGLDARHHPGFPGHWRRRDGRSQRPAWRDLDAERRQRDHRHRRQRGKRRQAVALWLGLDARHQRTGRGRRPGRRRIRRSRRRRMGHGPRPDRRRPAGIPKASSMSTATAPRRR